MYALYQLENGDLVCDYSIDPKLGNPSIILIQDENVEVFDCYSLDHFIFDLPKDAKMITKVNVDYSYAEENELGDFLSTITLSSTSNELIAEITREMCMGEYFKNIKMKRGNKQLR